MFPELDDQQRIIFPDPEEADREGLLASGGNLSPGVLLSAYEQGIFPWYSGDSPILWWSPDPRCILWPSKRHMSRSMQKLIRMKKFTVKFDTVFSEVIQRCAGINRKNEDGTWITQEMINAYCRLHDLGYAHSVEVWESGRLAGGLYGLSLGKIFFGESMFSEEKNSSKLAFLTLAEFLEENDFVFLDCQIYSEHLGTMGAEIMTRREYLMHLANNRGESGLYGSWQRFNQHLSVIHDRK